ncbi:MAG: M23 family metallopeptidase [Oscillospiraceae bacterium]|nr:M23 family metallopeptidase [Oscillospiraceae bacterium]
MRKQKYTALLACVLILALLLPMTASTATDPADRNYEYVDVQPEKAKFHYPRRLWNAFCEKVLKRPSEEDFNHFVTVVNDGEEPREYIKYVDFDVSLTALNAAFKVDVESYGTKQHFCWISLLAYLGTKYGGDFSKYRQKDMDALLSKLRGGETIEALTADMKHFPYYLEAYTAVLGGLVGKHRVEKTDANGETKWEERYGLRGFHPIAAGFGFSQYDDFGTGRNYGYRRKHLGHDIFGAVGTPIIAVESGVVEELGWNQYGGWRVGIRSDCGTRYHYYAHLRKNRPYHVDITEKGQRVNAGDVIGYMGHTGYSTTENVNNIKEPHLHYGLQLIFDESQKEGNNQIWVDLFAITKFLDKNRCSVHRVNETKEFYANQRWEVVQ